MRDVCGEFSNQSANHFPPRRQTESIIAQQRTAPIQDDPVKRTVLLCHVLLFDALFLVALLHDAIIAMLSVKEALAHLTRHDDKIGLHWAVVIGVGVRCANKSVKAWFTRFEVERCHFIPVNDTF